VQHHSVVVLTCHGSAAAVPGCQAHSSKPSSGIRLLTHSCIPMQATWTLQTYLALPWRPLIDIVGSTEYTLGSEANQVVEHVEAWNISGTQALLQILRPSRT
jgi:hypothetical protein